MIILAVDPSGSFNYGSGTTGWCLVDKEKEKIIRLGAIKAKDFDKKDDYINKHKELLEFQFDTLVIENFILYPSSASSFYHQELETSEIVGIIESLAKSLGKEVVRQRAVDIKTALKKPNILMRLVNRKQKQLTAEVIAGRTYWTFENKRVSNHIVDSIRHAFYYINKKRKEEEK